MNTKKFILTLVIIALLVLVLALGLIMGKKQGKEEGVAETEEKFAPAVDLAFPKPPPELKNLNGAVRAVSGVTIDLEVKDPDDYLPHADGTPQRTAIRYVRVTSATKIFTVDYSQKDANGNPVKIELALSGIKVGDIIKVTSTSDIKNASQFDATEIEVIR